MGMQNSSATQRVTQAACRTCQGQFEQNVCAYFFQLNRRSVNVKATYWVFDSKGRFRGQGNNRGLLVQPGILNIVTEKEVGIVKIDACMRQFSTVGN